MVMTLRNKLTKLWSCLGQSVLSLSFNLGGILAGSLLVLYFNVFSLASWALVVFPGILSMRGAIGGLFCGRLSTALHVGTVKPSYTKNTDTFYSLLSATVTLTFESSIMLGAIASFFGIFLWSATVSNVFSLLAVIISTMGLSIFLISPITVGVSFLAFKHGLDPDIIVYPIISTVADILITVCYVLALNVFFMSSQLARYLMGIFCFVFFFIVLYGLIKNFRKKEYMKTIKEFFLTLVLVAFIVNVTGLFLGRIEEKLAERQIVGSKQAIYRVYPALIDTVGDVGSIVGSTATTKLALGLIGSSFSSIKRHLPEIGGAWAASLIMFTSYSVISSFAGGIFTAGAFMKFTVQLLATNILAVSFMVLISYAVAIFTYKRGWDPDNFVIPIESSLADGITTVSLLAMLTLIV